MRHSRYAAEHIPGAKLVELPGRDHLPSAGDPEALLGELEEFLTGGRSSRGVQRAMLTVLFTDIVDSTGHAARLGDGQWRDLLAHQEQSVREVVERFNGTVVKTIGDAFLIIFDGPPSSALRCARAIVEAVRAMGLELHVGLHTGECEIIGEDVGGMAVHIASRVASLADAGGDPRVGHRLRHRRRLRPGLHLQGQPRAQGRPRHLADLRARRLAADVAAARAGPPVARQQRRPRRPSPRRDGRPDRCRARRRNGGAGARPDAIVTAMQTTVTELPESRVKVEAEVSVKEVERSLEQAAKALGKDMKMPGFRAGKVPTPVVIKRFGREAVLDQAVRGSLGKWYVEALEDAKIHPVGDPDLDLADLPEPGEPLRFSFEIGVRPTAKLGDYKGLEVERRGAEPDHRGRRRRARAAARARRPPGDRRGEGRRRATSSSWTTSARSTARSSRAARGATRWSSSAPAA